MEKPDFKKFKQSYLELANTYNRNKDNKELLPVKYYLSAMNKTIQKMIETLDKYTQEIKKIEQHKQ